MAALTFARPAHHDLPVPKTTAPTLPENSDEFVATVNEIITRANEIGNSIVAANLSGDKLTFGSVIEPLASWANWAALKWLPIECGKEFSPSKEVVEAATAAEVLYNQGKVSFWMRYDVWEAIMAYHETQTKPSGTDPSDTAPSPQAKELLGEVQARLFIREIRIRKDLGLDIVDPAVRDRLTKIETEVRSLSSRYYTAIKDRELGIWFTPEELDGVTSEFLQAYKQDDCGRYFVPFTIEDIFTLTRLAHNPDTRERILCDDANKWDNTMIQLEDGGQLTTIEAFRRVLQLKDEAARLKGFKNTAAAHAYRSMLGSTVAVKEFLVEFANALSSPGKQHVSDLLEVKKRDHEVRQIVTTDTNVLYHWDNAYYIGKLDKDRNQIDREVVREYFPVEHVIPQLFDWIQENFGLVICDLPTEAAAEPWDPSVRLFGVWSIRGPAKFVGYLYLDLFDRDNKQNQPSVETLQPAIAVDGVEYPPAVVLALDLKRPAQDWPALMYRSNLQDLFRNVPGAIARLLGTRSGYAELTAAQSKYPELQSVFGHVFARLAGDHEMLRKLSKHYSYISPEYRNLWLAQTQNQNKGTQPDESIPLDLAKRIEKDQFAGQAQPALRQIRYAQFDWDINSCDSPQHLQKLDLQRQYMDATADIVPTKGRESKPTVNHMDPEAWRVNGHGYLGIPQFLSSAGKGYRWMYSQAISEHLYQVIFPNGPFSPGIEDRYVDGFLGRAGIVDPFNALESIMEGGLSTKPFFERVRTAKS